NRSEEVKMASAVDAAGDPIPTSAVLTAASKHIQFQCQAENVAFLKCKKKDPNPEKCLDKGRQVTRCVLSLLKDLHQRCTKEMDAYVGCMYYNTNEFELCRKEQDEFEKKMPIGMRTCMPFYPTIITIRWAACNYQILLHTIRIRL
ncbi:Cox19-like CHCH family protein, partial [Prunus dulcis]